MRMKLWVVENMCAVSVPPEVKQIAEDIKEMKIRGAGELARAAVNALTIACEKSSAKNAQDFLGGRLGKNYLKATISLRIDEKKKKSLRRLRGLAGHITLHDIDTNTEEEVDLSP